MNNLLNVNSTDDTACVISTMCLRSGISVIPTVCVISTMCLRQWCQHWSVNFCSNFNIRITQKSKLLRGREHTTSTVQFSRDRANTIYDHGYLNTLGTAISKQAGELFKSKSETMQESTYRLVCGIQKGSAHILWNSALAVIEPKQQRPTFLLCKADRCKQRAVVRQVNLAVHSNFPRVKNGDMFVCWLVA